MTIENSSKILLLLLLASVLLLTGGCDSIMPAPPIAKIVPHTLEEFDNARLDNYYWLNQREDPEVIDYLNAENAYTEAIAGTYADFKQSLFDEITGRIKQDDESVPYKFQGYWYVSRYEEGLEYEITARHEGTLDAPEQIMLNENELAEGHDYFAARGLRVSKDNRILVFAQDTVGRRLYTLRFKNLETGEYLSDEIQGVSGNHCWANDNKTVFYTRKDPVTLRSYQVFKHVLGADPADDELVYQEDDDTFGVYVFRTKSQKYVMIACDQTLSSEYRYLDADRPDGEFTVFLPRQREHEYSLQHYGDHFYIRTNHQAPNFRLMRTEIGRNALANWEDVIPHRDDVLFQDSEIFNNYLMVDERREGLNHLRVIPWNGDPEYEIPFAEPAYVARAGQNVDFDTDVLRYMYTSMTTPLTTYDFDMSTREQTMMKQDEVVGDFKSSDYETDRIMCESRDGTMVPVSLVWRIGTRDDGPAPLLLYAYGSYGYSQEAYFTSHRLSLLDRGFIFAIAHVRGGQEMGRQWYEDGKLLKKINTFTDFIDCGQALIDQGYTNSDKLYAMGGSAGGLLVGAVINMAPELFHGAVAQVPFVDVVTTMLDDSIPLTTGEYDEWGNPNVQEYYDYMLSYSPYDNVREQEYPSLLVTTGLHDSQVQYFEPAKWVAKLRAMKQGDSLLLLRTDMESGHGGASGRFKRYEETAFTYTFLLTLAEIYE
jgi:oligopeptidase B